MLGTTKEIYLRAVSERDEALLLRWANESNVRSNSFSPNLIEPGDHKEWFQKVMADSNRLLLIATEINGCPIGQIRFDLNATGRCSQSKEASIDISLDRCVRGQGLAGKILKKGLQVMSKKWGSQVKAVAEVLHSNTASNACFASAKFSREQIENKDDSNGYSEQVNRWTLDPQASQYNENKKSF